MKSTTQQLQQRGAYTQADLLQFDMDQEECIKTLQHQDAFMRSIAVHTLAKKYHYDPDFTDLLLQRLLHESALYTKIEIQNALSQYGDLKKMCAYLGKIGNNQHRFVPSKVSLKKTYPLPRDLIARSIAHMDKHQISLFVQLLPQLSYQQLLEGIDALGFLCFSHQDVVTSDIYDHVQALILQYSHDELMTWKLITCLSAFPQSQTLLKQLQTNQKHPLLLKEIERSLSFIVQEHTL